MFYSSELLNRKTALGLVWLAGNSRRLSKVNILSTNVEEACNTILNPPVVLALRLQSTLLLGSCVILNRQADYLADDVDKILKKIQYAQDSIQSSDRFTAKVDSITLPECDGENTIDIEHYERIPENSEMRSVPFPLDPKLLTPKDCPSPTVARPDDLLLPEMNLNSFDDGNEDISLNGAFGELGGGDGEINQPLSFDHFQQFEESNADSLMREELEKRCEEEQQNQGDNFKKEWNDFNIELLPLACPPKRRKRAVVDEKLSLTDSELRAWFTDTSSITTPFKFRSWEEEFLEEKIERGCPIFSLFGTTLPPSLAKLFSVPPPKEEDPLVDQSQFRGVENTSAIDDELNAKIFVADHFGVSMDELFGGEMDQDVHSIHALRGVDGDETISNIQSIELSQLSGVRSTPTTLLEDTPRRQRPYTPQTLRDIEVFSPIHPTHREEGNDDVTMSPPSPGGGGEESNRAIDSFDSTTFQFLNYLRNATPLGKRDSFSSVAMRSLVEQIAGERATSPVASRTLYQVLVLASSGFLEVRQDLPYGEINLSAGEAL